LIYTLGDLVPDIAKDVFIADNAIVIGSVSIAPEASVWYGTVLRGDNDEIKIGERSNIQDGSVIHVDENVPTRIGNDVSVGHNTMIHGCTIGNGSLIGIGSVILNFARIGQYSLVGANSLVTEGKEFPDRSLILGSPAKVIRVLTDEEILQLLENADHYAKKSRDYQSRLSPWIK
jgi:carbonic anhydrase/acetyltransferase-like protein (isoleucine patch superfamily)